MRVRSVVVLLMMICAPAGALAQEDPAVIPDAPPPEPPPPESPTTTQPSHRFGEGPGAALAYENQDPISAFQSRALTLRARGGDDVQVMRNGHRIRDAELRAITTGNDAMTRKWEALDDTERKTDTLMAGGIGGCLAAPACGGILGGIAAVVALQAYTFATSSGPQRNPLSNVSTLVGGALAGVCLGCLGGGLILPMALATTMVVDAGDGSELKPEDYARLVSDHNRSLAKNLGLNPANLDPIYFPAG